MIDLVKNNPFRVLGVFSNARPADIVSNCDDMEAYLSVGQSVSFDLDFNNLLPTVARTNEMVAEAKRQINLPKDRLKHALFWLYKDSSSAHIVKYMKNGDFGNAIAVAEMDDTFSSLINKGVLAFMQEDYDSAVKNITTLIHDDDNNYRDDFVRAICGQAFSISEQELAELFIDSLLETISASTLMDVFNREGTSSDDVEYLRGKAVDEPLSFINNEIAKAKAVQQEDADANYRAATILMGSKIRNSLDAIKNLFGAGDLKYQMIADDLATTIMQCGINYFNNTDDDNDVEKALVIQEYALKIAVGRMCKDRCQKNLNTLNDIKKKRDFENTIGSDLTFIKDQLEQFGTKTDTIANAKNLVISCKPHLQSIKDALGATNDLYLKISSAVANNALGMIISVINSTQSLTSNITNGTLLSRVNEALSVMSIISSMDMTSQERNHYYTNKTTLDSIHLKLLQIGTSNGGGNSSGGCYIATMCYGDYDHPQVLVLRDFRDSILQQHSWGRAFVRFYYRHSPNWVEHLKDKKLINKIIRKTLDKFIILYKYAKK